MGCSLVADILADPLDGNSPALALACVTLSFWAPRGQGFAPLDPRGALEGTQVRVRTPGQNLNLELQLLLNLEFHLT